MSSLDFLSDDPAEVASNGGRSKDWYRYYAIHVRGQPALIGWFEQLIASVSNSQNCSRDQAILRIFSTGAEVLSKEPALANDASLKRATGLLKLLNNARQRAAQRADMVLIMRELGPGGILEAVESGEIDQETADRILADYNGPFAAALTQSDGIKNTLYEILADHASHSTDEIQRELIARGLLSDPETDKTGFERTWSLCKNIASTEGFSGGKRGMWQIATVES